MNYIQMGSITIPSLWLSVLLSFFIVAIIYRILFKEKLEEMFYNAFFYYILVWKFSYILFYFDYFVDTPISALYFDGGLKGHLLALLFVSLYFYMKIRKKNKWNRDALIVLILFFLLFEILSSLLSGNLISGIIFIAFLIGVLLFLKFREYKLSLRTVIFFLFVYFFILSFFEPILSIKNGTVLFIAILFLFMNNMQKEVQH